MVSGAARRPGVPSGEGGALGLTFSALAHLPRGALAASAASMAAVGFSVAIGSLPFPGALGVALGLPAAALAWARPRLALVLLAFSIPFSSWTKVSLGPYDVSATDALIALLLASWLARGTADRRIMVRGGPTIAAASALFGAAALSMLTATEFSSAVKEVIKLAEMVAVAIYAASTLVGAADVRVVVLAMVGAGTTEALIGLWQFATGSGPDSFALGPFMRAYGTFDQPNVFAGYLGLVLPFAVVLSAQRGPGQALGLGGTAIVGAAILASLSRAAWVGIGVGLSLMMLVWSQRTRRGLAVAATLAAIIAGAIVVFARAGAIPATFTDRLTALFENFWIFDVGKVDPTPANWPLVERMAHWQAAWAMAMDYPLVGVGPGNYEVLYPRYYLQGWQEPLGHAHNYYLNTFAEMGVIGLAALVVFTVSVFVRVGRGIGRASLPMGSPGEALGPLGRGILVAVLGAAVALSLHNLFDNLFVHGIGVQFGLILGLTEAQVRLTSGDAAATQHPALSTQHSHAHRD